MRRAGHRSPRGRTTLSPNGGSGVIRGATRRRHADSQLLKVQNPHHCRCGRHCEADQAGGDCTAWPRRCATGDGRTATGNKGGAEARQNSPNKNRTGLLPAQNSPSKNRAGPLPVQNSPSTPLLTACAVQNSPCSPKMALFGTFFVCMANFVPLPPATSHAWRTFSCTRHNNMATLKPPTPLQSLIQASMKPSSPLHAPNKGTLKPTSPLHPKTAPKTPISHPQRRRRFQPHTGTSAQRRQRFQTTRPPVQQGLAAVPVGGGRARAGLEIDHSEPSGSRVAISRAGRRPPTHTAARPIKASHAAAGTPAGSRAGRRPPTHTAARPIKASHAAAGTPAGSRAGRRPRAHQAAQPVNTYKNAHPEPGGRI